MPVLTVSAMSDSSMLVSDTVITGRTAPLFAEPSATPSMRICGADVSMIKDRITVSAALPAMSA